MRAHSIAPRTAWLAAVALLAPVSACNDILKVNNPAGIPIDNLNDPALLNAQVNGVIAELEKKIKSVSVVATDNVPEDVVFLGHTVKLQDTSDDSEQLVRIVGEAGPPNPNDEVMAVSVNSPMGEALMKARVGDTVKVKAPRGTMEFKILEIVQ